MWLQDTAIGPRPERKTRDGNPPNHSVIPKRQAPARIPCPQCPDVAGIPPRTSRRYCPHFLPASGLVQLAREAVQGEPFNSLPVELPRDLMHLRQGFLERTAIRNADYPLARFRAPQHPYAGLPRGHVFALATPTSHSLSSNPAALLLTINRRQPGNRRYHGPPGSAHRQRAPPPPREPPCRLH